MADLNKFEQMLEKLVNEDKAGAEELFHEIVVEKSRDIYESLLESDLADEEVDETTDEEVDESDEEVDESDDDAELDEDFNLDEFEVEADPMDDMMGDVEMPMGDMGGDDMGDEGEESTEERIDDLEDALEDLKAEFEKMMAGEDGEEEAGDDMDMDMDMDDEEGDEEEAEESYAFEETKDKADDDNAEGEVGNANKHATPKKKSEAETMREYVEKVSAKMGDNGANTKSPVAGKNDMGGTASNLAQGADEKGGKAAAPKEDNAGNVNVPGAKASKSMTSNAKGHGAEKKGAGETAANTKSIVGK